MKTKVEIRSTPDSILDITGERVMSLKESNRKHENKGQKMIKNHMNRESISEL